MRKLMFSIALLLAIAGCEQSQESSAAPSATEYSLAHKVAIVNAGHPVGVNHPSVARIDGLLKSLHAATGYSEEKIADQAAATRNLMRDQLDRHVTIVDLLAAANNAETVQSQSVKLEEYFAVYAAMSASQ